ncbi:MAG: hypothetical protein JWO31_1786 [Phycisphaerales bacterium]|nr:hypothetical protein [Phycisphaerales bacterium]
MTDSLGGVVLPAAVAASAAVVLVWARRGRRVDDHPLCRRCGFDLTGTLGRSERCPECGQELEGPRAVRYGHREPRRAVLVPSVVLLSAAAAWLGVLTYVTVRGVDPIRLAPAWWLSTRLSGQVGPSRAAELAEVARRAGYGSLPADSEAALVRQALDVQADVNLPWDPNWGRLVERARSGGRVADDQWGRYAAGSLALWLEARPRVRLGDRLPLRVRAGLARRGDVGFALAFAPPSEVSLGQVSATMSIRESAAGHEYSGNSDAGWVDALNYTGVDAVPIAAAVSADARPTLGTRPASIELSLHPKVSGGGPATQPAHRPVSGALLRLQTSFELLAADRPTVTTGPDRANPSLVGWSPAFAPGGCYGDGYRPPEVVVRIGIDVARMPVVLRAVVSAGGTVRGRSDDMAVWRAGEGGEQGIIVRSATPLPGRVDVRLESAPDLAARTVEVDRVWTGSVEFRDVPVTWR